MGTGRRRLHLVLLQISKTCLVAYAVAISQDSKVRKLVMMSRPTRSSYSDQPLSVVLLQATRTRGVRAVQCYGVSDIITSAVNSPLNERLGRASPLVHPALSWPARVSRSRPAYGYVRS